MFDASFIVDIVFRIVVTTVMLSLLTLIGWTITETFGIRIGDDEGSSAATPTTENDMSTGWWERMSEYERGHIESELYGDHPEAGEGPPT